jgi:TolA-binding protein
MVCLWRLILILLLVLPAPAARAASAGETRAFNAGANAFQAGIWDRAETDFAEFVEKFPTSSRLAEAVLLQAEARLQQTNYAGCIDLLNSRFAQAGPWADQYIFWLGEAYFQKGDFKAATESFDNLLRQFPASVQRLAASLGQANAFARLGDWKKVIALLQQTDGAFQTAVKASPASPLSAQGYLLLGEAHLALKDPAAAAAALEPVARIDLDPFKAWQRQFLLNRIAVAQNRLPEALQGATNLLALSGTATQRGLLAESVAFTAGLLEQLGRSDEALAVYTNNLAEGTAPERQQQALLKITELSIARTNSGLAVQTLSAFLAKSPDSPAAPLALLTVGELQLREHLATPGQTNLLPQALAYFSDLTNRFPSSPLLGRAQLNLGWGFWRLGKLPESESAFRAALALLPPSLDQATAAFKLGDVEFQQQDYTNAISNYRLVGEKFTDLPEVKTNLAERALYQAVRASLAAGDLGLATNLMARIITEYPNGFLTDNTVLLTGQQLAAQGNPAAARAVFSQFLAAAPNSQLAPEIELAIARTFERENKWTAAVQQYEQWVSTHTNHLKLEAACYYLGWSAFQAGRETNALTAFTNLIARFPNGEFAPLAQFWVADYFLRSGNPVEAETNYAALFYSTNVPPPEYTYQARLMAGHAALARQGWTDGINHFTNLTSDLTCPVDLRIQAIFAYGDTLIKMDTAETNRLGNLENAIRLFATICENYSTNRLAPLAWGQKANCLLQWAHYTKEYDSASNAFFQVIQAPQAGATARSIAKMGLGIVFEKKAELAAAADKAAWLKLARDQYLDVFYNKLLGENETADVFWKSRAGWEVARLAEQTQQWPQAISIYEQLKTVCPVLTVRWERGIRKAQEQIARGAK